MITVNQNIIAPTSNAGQGAFLTCEATEVILTGSGTSQSGNTSYEWRNEGGVTVGDMRSVAVTEIGIYTLIITDDANGCTASSTVEVEPDADLPVANAGTSATLNCDIIEVVLNGNNSSSGTNITYEWQNAATMILGTEVSQMVNSPGIYTLIVTDTDNGCTATSTVEVFEDISPPMANAGIDTTLTCEEDKITLDGGMSTAAMGTLSFEWFDESGTSLSSTQTVEVQNQGIYTLVTKAINGCTDSDEVTVFLDANVPEAITGAGGLLTCTNLMIELGDANSNPGLNVVYEWTNANDDVLAATPVLEVMTPDTYTLTVTNLDNNCIATSSITILQDITAPLADAGLSETLTCTLIDYELGGLGTSVGTEYTYEWRDGNNLLISEQINPTISTQGIYTLTVTNENNGCTASSTVNIDQNIQNPNADAGADGILTCSISEVTLDGSNSSGDNLSYEWQNEAGVIIDNQALTQVGEVGVFTLIVRNGDNGCTASATTTVIPDGNLPTANATADGTLTCVLDMVNLDANDTNRSRIKWNESPLRMARRIWNYN